MGIQTGYSFRAGGLYHDLAGVGQTGKGGAVQQGGVQQFLKPLFQGPEGAQQVSAVNRGDVAGFKGSQGLDIVPVEEMPLIALQTTYGVHGGGQFFNDLVNSQIAAIMGSKSAGHPEPDVGRAGSHGQAILMCNLIVVRGEPGGIGVDECGEVAPGSPGDLPEEATVLFPHLLRCLMFNRSQVQQPAEQRREKPRNEPGSGLGQAGRHEAPDRPSHEAAEKTPQCQACDKKRLPTGSAPLGCLGRPLQQIASGNHASIADPDNGIQAHRCLVRQQGGVGGCPQQVVQQFGGGKVL